MHMYKRIVGLIRAATEYVMIVAIAVMFAAVVLQVVSRYVAKMPFPWVEELARYLMIWVGFLGCGIAARRGAHVSITFLADRFPPRVARYVSLLVNLCIVIFLGCLIKYGIDIMSFTRLQRAATMPITMSWAYASIPVGSALLLIEYIEELVSLISRSDKASKEKSRPC